MHIIIKAMEPVIFYLVTLQRNSNYSKLSTYVRNQRQEAIMEIKVVVSISATKIKL